MLALKGNQGTLSKHVEHTFEKADQADYEGYDMEYFECTQSHANRTETRRHWTLPLSDTLIKEHTWSGLNVIAMVESERTVRGEPTSIEHRYYIGSIGQDAKRFAHAVRSHWGGENQWHWQLDVSFGEDQSRMRTGHSAENFSVIRRIALNLPSQAMYRTKHVESA